MAARRQGPSDTNHETEEQIDVGVPEEEISLDASDDDEEPGGSEDSIDKGPSRQEKKTRRRRSYLENQEAREKAEREASELRAQLTTSIAQNQQALAYAQQLAAQSGQRQQDPIDQAETQAVRERQLLYKEYQQRAADAAKRPITQQEQDDFERRALEIENRQMDLRVERRMRDRGLTNQPNAAAETLRVQLSMAHPEVAQDQRALVFADGIYRTLVAQGKNPNALETFQEAMDKAEAQFRYGKYKNGGTREPDPTLRTKLQGNGKGSSGSNADMPSSIVVTPAIRKQALRAFPDEKDEKKRVTKWVRTIGKGLLQDGVDLSELK